MKTKLLARRYPKPMSPLEAFSEYERAIEMKAIVYALILIAVTFGAVAGLTIKARSLNDKSIAVGRN